jgi:YaeC family lipoprotein
VTPGPHAEIVEEVRRVAASRGLAVDVVAFADCASADAALAKGRIDADSCEDGPAFDSRRAQHGYPLARAASTITFPMALYSRKLKALSELKTGAVVAIPADPGGAARALILLQNFTLLSFRDEAGLHATPADITSNRMRLKIRQAPRAKLADTLNDASIVVMDSDDAARAGLAPARDGIGMEDARSPFASVLAVRAADRAQPWVGRLIAAYQSDDVARFILVRYQDSVRRPW